MLQLYYLINVLLADTVLPPVEEKYNYQPAGPIAADQPVTDIFSNASSWLLATIGVIAAISLVIGGIQYATALGDSDKIDQAKRTLKWTIVGIVLALLAFIIVPTIARLFQ